MSKLRPVLKQLLMGKGNEPEINMTDASESMEECEDEKASKTGYHEWSEVSESEEEENSEMKNPPPSRNEKSLKTKKRPNKEKPSDSFEQLEAVRREKALEYSRSSKSVSPSTTTSKSTNTKCKCCCCCDCHPCPCEMKMKKTDEWKKEKNRHRSIDGIDSDRMDEMIGLGAAMYAAGQLLVESIDCDE